MGLKEGGLHWLMLMTGNGIDGTIGEDGKKIEFATVFSNRMVDAGGGERRYCGESVVAVMCIFSGNCRVEGGGVIKERK